MTDNKERSEISCLEQDQQIRDEEILANFVKRYRQIFCLDANHAGEGVALSISGETVLFHVERQKEPYQADKSTMDEAEWSVLIRRMEQHSGKSPWVVIPGARRHQNDTEDLTEDEEEKLLEETGEEPEDRDACERDEKRGDQNTKNDEKSRDEQIRDEMRHENEMRQRKAKQVDQFSVGKNLPSIKSIQPVNLEYLLAGKVGTDNNTEESKNANSKALDAVRLEEMMALVKSSCLTSTGALKQFQGVLTNAQAAVANMEKMQKEISKEFERQREAFVTQTKIMEERNNETKRQLNEMREEYEKLLQYNYEWEEQRDEDTAQERVDESEPRGSGIDLSHKISKIVREEMGKVRGEKTQKAQNTDNLANQVKETLKLEIINKNPGMKRDYKLTTNTKFEHFHDYFTSELRTLELLHIIEPENTVNANVDPGLIEKQKYRVRDILINHLDENYHSKVMLIQNPVEILKKIREIKRCESNVTSTTLRKQLYNLKHYSNKGKASEFCDKFEEVVRNYDNLSEVTPLSEIEKRDAFFNAIMTTVPEVQSVEFMTKNSTGRGLTYEELKLFLLQAEANKNQSGTVENRAVMHAQGQSKERCYECDDTGHKAINCRFKGTGLKKCYECGQITQHKAAECPMKKIKQPGPGRGRGTNRGFNRGTHRYHSYRSNTRGGKSYHDNERYGNKRKYHDERLGGEKRLKTNRGRGVYKQGNANERGNKGYANKEKERDERKNEKGNQ
ncbi:uncharacterized protein [Venturia canescens]|uniref:uncharacterized protein isoform X2 n=1 Tax=Venturia canescens TaxID=32260 RepID=UPI001C9CFF8C|nr:uncharacterized protein LOC122416506 isoform X2 [Venturia canescens]